MRVIQRHIDVLALVGTDPSQQGRIDRGDRVDAGVHVAQRNTQQRWRLTRYPHHLHDAALGFGDQAKACTVGVRSGVSVGRNRAVHQLRVALGELLVTQAQFVQRAGTVVLDEDVGTVAQRLHE